MKDPVNFYRYSISNEIGTLFADPLGESDFIIEWNRVNEEKLDYSKDLPSKVLFKGAVFDNLYLVERTVRRCQLMTITVERNCGGAWVVWFSGRFQLNEAEFNLYRCEVEIKIQKNSPDQCLEDNKNTELNLFQYVFNRYAAIVNPPGTIIERVIYDEITDFPDLTGRCSPDYAWGGVGTPEAGAWVAYWHEYYTEEQIGAGWTRCFKQTRFARQRLDLPITDPQPGPDWILASTASGINVWVRPALLYACVEEQIPPNVEVLGGYRKSCEVSEPGTNTVAEIDNGMKLEDVLEAFLTNLCPTLTVKSEFFQINPDVVTSTNYVTGQPTKVSNILVYQKSDVKRPAVSGNASKAEIDFEKLMLQLYEMFWIRWRVIGSVLRIEHVSYFSKAAGLDLTLPRYDKQTLGMEKYNYTTEAIPPREEYKFMEASPGDFAGVPILYTGCVSESTKPKVHAAEFVTTDVELCLNNPDPKSSVVDDKGFVFIACSPTGIIISELPILDTNSKLNNSLSWAHLHRDYHKYYRPLSSGIMNNVNTAFFSVEPTKKGIPVSIPLNCGDTFNPDDTVLTSLGVGTVEKAVFNFKSCFLTLDLLYPADLDLYVPAIAANNVFTVSAGANVLDVISNDTPSPSGPITQIEIVSGPLHGSAIVVAGPAIQYTPTGGYTGSDNIVYRVKDSFGFPSNNALIALNVT